MSERTPPRATLPPEDFRLCGRAILGRTWRGDLAAELGLPVEMVNGWADGGAPVPFIVIKTLAALARFRGEDLLRISDQLTADLEGWLGET